MARSGASCAPGAPRLTFVSPGPRLRTTRPRAGLHASPPPRGRMNGPGETPAPGRRGRSERGGALLRVRLPRAPGPAQPRCPERGVCGRRGRPLMETSRAAEESGPTPTPSASRAPSQARAPEGAGPGGQTARVLAPVWDPKKWKGGCYWPRGGRRAVGAGIGAKCIMHAEPTPQNVRLGARVGRGLQIARVEPADLSRRYALIKHEARRAARPPAPL